MLLQATVFKVLLLTGALEAPLLNHYSGKFSQIVFQIFWRLWGMFLIFGAEGALFKNTFRFFGIFEEIVNKNAIKLYCGGSNKNFSIK